MVVFFIDGFLTLLVRLPPPLFTILSFTFTAGPGGRIDDCDSVTQEYCTAFADTEDCCPECATKSTKYLDCFLESLDASSCPEASCENGNTKALPSILGTKEGDGSSTKVEMATTASTLALEEETSSAITSSAPIAARWHVSLAVGFLLAGRMLL